MPDCDQLSNANAKIFIVGEFNDSERIRLQLANRGYKCLFTFRELIDAAEALSLLQAELMVTNANLEELQNEYLIKLAKKHPLVIDVPIVAIDFDATTERGVATNTDTSGIRVDMTIQKNAFLTIENRLNSGANKVPNANNERIDAVHVAKMNLENRKKEQSLRLAFQRSC